MIILNLKPKNISNNLKNKSILLALGVRHIEEAITFAKASGAKVYARVLANPESIKKVLSSSFNG